LGYSFESLSHVSEVPLKPESSIVAVAIAVAGVIYFDSDGGPSTLSSFRPINILGFWKHLRFYRIFGSAPSLKVIPFRVSISILFEWADEACWDIR